MRSRRFPYRGASVAALLLLLGATVVNSLCLPQKEYDEFKVTVGNQGAVQIAYFALNITGNLVIWGPGWSWDTVCSWQPNWPPGSLEGEGLLSGELTCNFGDLSWREGFILRDEAVVLEFELAALSDVRIADIAWQLGLPIASFAGSFITAITSEGFLRNVTLRPEYVPGQSGLGSYTGVGWIVPFGTSTGILFFAVSDSRSFIGLTATDEREWGGSTYTARVYFNADRITWKPGNRIRGVVCVYPYSSQEQLNRALRQAESLLYLLRAGVSFDDIVKLIREGRLEEEAQRMEAQRRTMLLIYASAAVAVVALVIAIMVYKVRKSRGKKAVDF